MDSAAVTDLDVTDAAVTDAAVTDPDGTGRAATSANPCHVQRLPSAGGRPSTR